MVLGGHLVRKLYTWVPDDNENAAVRFSDEGATGGGAAMVR
jgi:hypothetical protein